MKRVVIVLMTVAVAIAFTAAATASPRKSENSQAGGKPVTIPDQAKEVAPGVYYLGEQKHRGQVVEGYMYVRYEKGYHHRDGHGGGPPGGGDGGSGDCYSYIFDKHTEWQNPEDWIVNPDNSEGLVSDTIMTNLTTSVGRWESAAESEIFGVGETTSKTLTMDSDSPDDKNEVFFGSIEDEGAIAVTLIWARSRGQPSSREIIEWDQVYDQVDFSWSTSGEEGKMDFQNINAHELGHSAGIGHTDCSEQTMYGTATTGETKKRSLERGDEAGVTELYS